MGDGFVVVRAESSLPQLQSMLKRTSVPSTETELVMVSMIAYNHVGEAGWLMSFLRAGIESFLKLRPFVRQVAEQQEVTTAEEQQSYRTFSAHHKQRASNATHTRNN